MHVETFAEFKHVSKLLRVIRGKQLEFGKVMDVDMVKELIKDLDDKSIDTDELVLFGANWDIRSRSDAIYRYLYPKLNSTLQSMGRTIGNKNGFELYRLVSQECDTI